MSYYKTTRQEYLKVKKGGQSALDEVISVAVEAALKDYGSTGSDEQIKEAYNDGYQDASKELEKRYTKEISKAIKEAQRDAFEEGRKSQKEYLTKKEKERILAEMEAERILKEKKKLDSNLLDCYINNMGKDIEKTEDAINATKALTVAVCTTVLKENFWKKGYDKRIPVFLEEMIQLENNLNAAKVDDMCRFTRKYVKRICEDMLIKGE